MYLKDPSLIILQSQEGHCILIPIEIASRSKIIAFHIREIGLREAMNLPNLSTAAMVDIANLMVAANISDEIRGYDSVRLARLANTADYLELEMDTIVDKVLEYVSLRVFGEDLHHLANSHAYQNYLKNVIEELPVQLLEKVILKKTFTEKESLCLTGWKSSANLSLRLTEKVS